MENESILKMLKLPDLLSVVNALFGLSAILLALTSGASEKVMEKALVFILMAAVVDGIDGLTARSVEQSPLGIYLDSLADMLSFGIAPAIIAYVSLHKCFLFGLSSYIVSEAKRFFEKEKVFNDDFEGFPITGGAIFLASFMLLFIELQFHFYSYLYFFLLIGQMGILCLLMTSRIRYRNIRDRRIAIPVGIVFFTLFFFYFFDLPFVYPTCVIVALTAFYMGSPLKVYFTS
jgi:CDP-diacylglycerol--serine O-phosphatidyltransferase